MEKNIIDYVITSHVNQLCAPYTKPEVRADVERELTLASKEWQKLATTHPDLPRGNFELFMLLCADIIHNNPSAHILHTAAFKNLMDEFTETAVERFPARPQHPAQDLTR